MATATPTRDERRLRRSATMAGVGDGVVAVALPLLAAGVTRDPLAVAAVVAAQHLPWVLVALGWPRLGTDRRTVVGLVDTGRALALGYLGYRALLGRESILLIQLVAFAVGLGEAITDGTETETGDVTGLSTRGMVGLAVVGLPLGGVLYEIFPATPFLFDMLGFATAGLLALFVARPLGPGEAQGPLDLAPDDETVPPPRGITWAATLAAAGTGAVVGVLVLFALDDLGLGAPAFGFLLAGLTAAATVGGWLAPLVGGRLGLRAGVIAALLGCAAGYVAASELADPHHPWWSALALGVSAGCGVIAAVLSRALLQVSLGRPLRGEVLTRLHLAVWTAIPTGALAGGWLARPWDVSDVLLAAAAVCAAAAVLAALPSPVRKSFDDVEAGVVRSPEPSRPARSAVPEEV